MRLRALDSLTVVYILVALSVITLAPFPPERPLHAACAFCAVVLAVAASVFSGDRAGHGWRVYQRVYPLAVAVVMYSATQYYVLVLHGRFLDADVVEWETSVIGRTVYDRLAEVTSRPLTEFMMLCYFSYYLVFLVPPLLLVLRGRLDALERYVFSMALALYTCFLGFVALPLLGPTLFPVDRPPMSGLVVTSLQNWIMEVGDPRGTTFPSGHVTGTWTAVACIWRAFGTRAGLACLPLAVCITVAVVYTANHYLIDVVAGALLAAVAWAVAPSVRSLLERLTGTEYSDRAM